MKRLLVVLLIAALAMGMVGFAGAAGAEAAQRKLKFAWCTDNVDISQQTFYDTAKAYCDHINSTREDIQIEMSLFDGQANVEKQISDIETALAMNVDAIILSCVDPAGITPIAKQAMSEGVPILDWRDMGNVCTITFIGGDENTKGVFNYEWTKKYLEEHPDAVLNAGLQQGSTNHPICFPRMQYMYKLVDEFPGRFNVLVEQNSDWSADTSMKMVEDWLQAYPDMNFISSSSEEQMLGVIEALKGGNELENFVLTTFNGEATGCEMLQKKEIDMDVGVVMPIMMGRLIESTVNMVLDGLTGRIDISEEIMYAVTQDNVDEYIKMIATDYENIEYFPTSLKEAY